MELRQNPKCDRKVSFYGYVRGANVKTNSKIHLLGIEKAQLVVLQVQHWSNTPGLKMQPPGLKMQQFK